METLIVTIPAGKRAELQEWLDANGGTYRPWNRVIGNHGVLYSDAAPPSLNEYLRLEVAARTPGRKCPQIGDMPAQIAHEVLHIAANSYEWSHESHLDPSDLNHTLNLIEPTLEPRGNVQIADGHAKLEYLKTLPVGRGLPGWENLNDRQIAIIDEAFGNSTEWQTEGRLSNAIRPRVEQLLMLASG